MCATCTVRGAADDERRDSDIKSDTRVQIGGAGRCMAAFRVMYMRYNSALLRYSRVVSIAVN